MNFKSLKTIKDFDFSVGAEDCVRVSDVAESVSASEVNLILWILLEQKFGQLKIVDSGPPDSNFVRTVEDQLDCASKLPLTYPNQIGGGLPQQTAQARQYTENLLRCVGVNVPFKLLTSSEKKRLFQQFCESSDLLLTEKYSSILDLYEALRRRSKFREQFNVHSMLGEGKYGKVYAVGDKNIDINCTKCTYAEKTKQERKIYAIKKIYLTFDALEDVKMILNESAILKRLKGHPSIVTFYNSWLAMEFEQDDGDSQSSERLHDDTLVFYLQMELCGVSLYQWKLHLKEERPSEQKCLLIAKQLADGIDWIHQNGFLHLDINPRNIFWSNSNLDNIKIGDFGLAVQSERFSERRGTPAYCAPELQMTSKSDIFSVGVTLFEMAQVFPTRSELITRLEKRDFVTGMQTLDQVLPSLLAEDPTQRWDAFRLKANLEKI